MHSGTISAVAFDIDGVLVRSEDAHYHAFRATVAPFGVELARRDYLRDGLGRSREAVLQALLGPLPEPRLQALMLQKEVHTRAYIADHGLPEVPGALDFARSLGCPKAAVTASRSPDLLLGAIGAQGLFPVVIDALSVSRPKPHPESYLRAAERLGVDPRQMLVIEDSPSGIEAARGAGCTVIALTTTRSPEELAGATYIVKDFVQIAALFAELP